MSTLIVDALQGLADPSYASLPTGICDPACLDFETINGKLRLTIKKNSLDGSFFSGDFIPDGSITSSKVANGAIGTNQLADGAVTTSKIADHAVTQIKLAFGAVTNTEIASGTILSSNIAPNAVVTDSINNSAVTHPKLASGCITSTNLSPASVNNPALATGCVSYEKLGEDVKSFILSSAALPAGTILASGRAAPSPGFIPCDGAQISRSVYGALWGAIGTIYGPGDGQFTFNVPDLRGRTPFMVGPIPNTLHALSLGSFGGEETHTLSLGEMPYHTHNVVDNGHNHNITETPHSHPTSQIPHKHEITDPTHQHGYIYGNLFGGQGLSSGGPPPWYNNFPGQTGPSPTGIGIIETSIQISVGNSRTNLQIAGALSGIANQVSATGSSAPHNNMPPFLAINYFIKT